MLTRFSSKVSECNVNIDVESSEAADAQKKTLATDKESDLRILSGQRKSVS